MALMEDGPYSLFLSLGNRPRHSRGLSVSVIRSQFGEELCRHQEWARKELDAGELTLDNMLPERR
jgi:hypothetical protein